MKLFNILKNRNGSSSVLIILILLSLTTFGVLSMISAYSDRKLAEKGMEWVKNYYELDSGGERWLSGVGSVLRGAREEPGEYFLIVTGRLSKAGYDVRDPYYEGGGPVVATDIALNLLGEQYEDSPQHLSVEIELRTDGGYRVIRWQQWQQKFDYLEDEGVQLIDLAGLE